jgi:hypothetical protein
MLFHPRDKLLTMPREYTCTECGGELLVEFDEWFVDTGAPSETGVHVQCRNERDGDGHWQMPYVTLLPLQKRVYAWCAANVRLVESEAEARERLRAWNAGEAIKCS